MINNDIINNLPIFSNYNGHSLSDLEKVLKTTKKSILQDVEKINDVLAYFNYPVIEICDNKLWLPNVSIKELFSKMSPELSLYYFQDERVWMIILYIFLEYDFISNYHFQEFLRVSKNTVLSDLKELRIILEKYKVELKYSRKDGYYFLGKSIHIRQILETALNEIMAFESGKWIIRYTFYRCRQNFEIDPIIRFFHSLSQKEELSFIEERIETTAYLILFLQTGKIGSSPQYSDKEIREIAASPVIHIVEDFMSIYPELECEKYFIASRLLGCIQGNLYLDINPKIVAIMEDMIEVVTANTGIIFNNNEQFRMNLYNHLAPAYYRLMFDMNLINPLKDQIIEEYSSLFYLVKKSMFPLANALNKNIPADEIAYFTMHFGGYITAYQSIESNRMLTALTICPKGVSSSLILTSELQAIMPEIKFNGIHQLDKIKELDSSEYDLIFSTVYFETEKPLFLVQPFMNPVEKSLLKKKVYSEFLIRTGHNEQIEEIITIVGKHAEVKDELLLKEALFDYFFDKTRSAINWEGVTLSDLLQKSLIQKVEKVADWQEGIRLAAKPLEQQGYIEATYIDAMIDSIKKLGAYIVLAPHVAVPHASPKEGVKRLGMSLLQIQEPVNFNLEQDEYDEDREVHLIFVLAAIDSTAHLRALQQLVMIIENEETIDQLIAANSCEAIEEIINKSIKQEESYD
ncbi:BglG family transcription antiterminator [Ignavigranum ruoffiae]|uniref:BglG family transcription antiterminator n=1 Tax=Ignavigranum ruoffiae TaxID=89093 RepID=UPI0024AD05A3|nr:BglG family transcription antiterminator [Ignavigranum ruoffiae]